MTLGSCFSGIGGIDLGFELAGIPTSWQIEKDDWCRSKLEKHFPNAKRYSDITTVQAEELEPVDIIAGGFPCQDISSANPYAKGLAGARSGLWFEMLRLIDGVRPTWVVVENVSRFIQMGADTVCDGLEEIGYTLAPPISFPACAVGLPTMERHVWIIGQTNGIRSRRSVVSEIQNFGALQWQLPREDQRNFNRWSIPASRVCGVGEGIARRMDRIKSLGNAVPPLMAKVVADFILTANRADGDGD